MSFDWNDVGQRRRLLLDLRHDVSDLGDVAEDVFAPEDERVMGRATHRQRCEELLKGLLHTIDYALATSGGAAPSGEPEAGAPTAH